MWWARMYMLRQQLGKGTYRIALGLIKVLNRKRSRGNVCKIDQEDNSYRSILSFSRVKIPRRRLQRDVARRTLCSTASHALPSSLKNSFLRARRNRRPILDVGREMIDRMLFGSVTRGTIAA